MKKFEIYFDDLKKESQKELLKLFNMTEKEDNWDVIPLAIINYD